MTILGIDPGSLKMGYALIAKRPGGLDYLDSGVSLYAKERDFLRRLGLIHADVRRIVGRYRPDHIAVESLVYVKNVSSLAKLSQARGAALAAVASDYAGRIFEHSPNAVKQAVCGHGHASKESVGKALGLFFPALPTAGPFASDDESDALAIAVCHAMGTSAFDRPIDGSAAEERA